MEKILHLSSAFSEPLYASSICKLFERLSLNFLKLPEDTIFIPPLMEDENNIYKSNVLTWYNKKSGKTFFVSILQLYQVPPKSERLSQTDYNKSKSSFYFI